MQKGVGVESRLDPARHRARAQTRRRAVHRRRRVVAAACLLGLAALAAKAFGVDDATIAGGAKDAAPAGPTVLTVGVARWRIPTPISGEVVVPRAGRLTIAGGLQQDGASARGVVSVAPSSGDLVWRAPLARPVHDAAGAMLDGRVVVFGGGSSATTADIQTVSSGGAAQGRLLGRLPRPRSDLAVAELAGRAYLVGGYDGARPSAEVYSTRDGATFVPVASLPDPVRYPAVATARGRIYALGGKTAAGDTRAIQEVDPRARNARVIGRLPAAVSHAAAFALGGQIYVVGGRIGGAPTDRIWRFDPARGTVTAAGRLPVAESDAGAAVAGGVAYVVGGRSTHALSTVITLRPARPGPAHREPAAARRAPFTGRLLIADRGNNRLLLVDARKRLRWRYPSAAAPPPPGGFYFPDDAFFVGGGSGIISNEEDNHTIVRIGFPSGRLEWSYGHPRAPGSAPGYLNQPDDAYLLRDGRVVVADARNCRILVIGPGARPRSQIGTTGSCVHDPPRSLAYPNGDTPLPDGNLLVSEVNGSYVDELTLDGRLRWSLHLPIGYPSDPQQLGRDRYLVCDYARPGGIYEFTRAGRITWAYHPAAGAGMLDHPSLAERLPTGLIAVNDDYRHRVAIIDPRTHAIVWQYGHTDHPGRGPGALNTPDGFDLLAPGGRTPTHPQTG
jgi:outer membrane protein assembly factor BamB